MDTLVFVHKNIANMCLHENKSCPTEPVLQLTLPRSHLEHPTTFTRYRTKDDQYTNIKRW